MIFTRNKLAEVLLKTLLDGPRKLVGAAFGCPVFFFGEFEDFEPVFGDGNAHALKKLVVEVGGIFQLKLVAGEGKAILVDEGGF